MATVITRLEAYGYRCFPVLSVDLDQYHVLTGTNGAGKTTLLDIPTLLGELLGAARPSDVFLRRQGSHPVARARTVGELLHNGRGNAITFSVEARLPANIENTLATTSSGRARSKTFTHLRYELSLEVFNYDLQVAEEHLFLFAERGNRPQAGVPLQGSPSGGGLRPGWRSVISRAPGSEARFSAEPTTRTPRLPQFQIPDDKLALAALPADPTLFPAALWLVELLREGVVFFSPDWAALQHGSAPNDPSTLLPSGRNLTWLALELQRAHKNTGADSFESWVDHVRTALPQVERISVRERESDRYAYFVVDYAGGYQVTSSGLSEGTLRILALTLLPYLTPTMSPRLLVTEEPENGIHPRAIETVMQSLDSLYDTQVWVSTHSPLVLAQTKLADVLAARLDNEGAVTVVAGNEHPRLRDWQGSLDIGTLFAAGVLS